MLTADETQFLLDNQVELNQSVTANKTDEFLSCLSDSGVKCMYCNQSTVTYRLLQTRSADEGMTMFYACIGCGKKWHT
jgi:DNA-directed RNA polymerase subunit M/transcription elongation factor TFIIS